MDALASRWSSFFPPLSSSFSSSHRQELSCNLPRKCTFSSLAWIFSKNTDAVFCKNMPAWTRAPVVSGNGVAILSDENEEGDLAENHMLKSEDEIPIAKGYTSFPAILDIQQIQDILPHRPPFLFVDRVVEYQPGVTVVALKNVTINDGFFAGHFPERPIMPGVLIIEALAQVGGIMFLQPEMGGSKSNFFLAGIDKVRFRKPVIPGDTLVMRMNVIKLQKRFGVVKMEGKAYVGQQLVCEGEFMMYLNSKGGE